MSAFVDTSRVAVTEGTSTIYVKRKMDFGTKCRVEDTLTQMAIKNGAVDNIRYTIGAQKLALAIHNIVGWEGPEFGGLACTEENIQRLDPEFPPLLRAQEKINELNTPREPTPDPNDSTTTGEQS